MTAWKQRKTVRGHITTTKNRSSLPSALARRSAYFARAKWNRLDRADEGRKARFPAYVLGASASPYSLVEVAYDLNIVAMDVLRLPFWNFCREQIVPFMAMPLR